jgi:hypothetical protein
MPQGRHIQTSLASGEFDPLLWSREDVTFFYSSARVISNAIALPQGGATRREGWRTLGLQRGAISAISLASASATAPNGGTAANLIDDDPATLVTTTTSISTTTEYVIARLDVGAAVTPYAFDCLALQFVTLPGFDDATITLQRSTDDAAWTDVASLQVGTTAYDRRFAAAPQQSLGEARYWRIVVDNPTGADLDTATVQLGEVRLWTEELRTGSSTAPGNFRMFRLTASIVDEFYLVLTAGNCDIWRTDTGAWVAAVAIPHANDQVAEVTSSASLDTMIFYQEDVAQHLVQRLGADGDWRSEPLEFDTVTRFAFNDANVTGGENEKQLLRFESMTAGDRVVVEFNGEISDEVTWNASEATNIANLEAAIEGLDDIGSVSVTVDSGTGVNAVLEVEFTGADGLEAWPILVIDILTGSGTLTIQRTQYGRPPTDDLWSATRGYPRCGTFYQGRHWMGGFKARPDLLVGSRVGALFDFKEDDDPVPGSPIVAAPNIDEQITILQLYAGRHLQIFTSSAELYIPAEPITIDNLAVKITSRRGASAETQPLDIQGGTIFVDRTGRALREYLFTDAEQSYTAEPISLLAGHLVAQPNSMVLRRQRDVDEPTLILLANQGLDRTNRPVPSAAITIDRAQQVTGFCRIETQLGTVQGFQASQAGDAVSMVKRQLAGNEWNYLELWDGRFMSDAAVEVENPDVTEFLAPQSASTTRSYSFTSPATTDLVAVWARTDLTEPWTRLDPATDYTVDLGAQEIELTEARPTNSELRIVSRKSSVDLSSVAPWLEGIECQVHVDGLPIGLFTPSSGSIDLGDARYDFAIQVGLRMVPSITLHPYKGRGEMSPTMKPQRIHTALLQFERTLAASITMHAGGRLRPIPFENWDSAPTDKVLEELLFTGTKRIKGGGAWQTEPTVTISQDAPGPWTVRAITYDVRY